MKNRAISIVWDGTGPQSTRAHVIRPQRGPDSMGGRVTIAAMGTARLADGRRYRIDCERYAPRALSGEPVRDSVVIYRDGRRVPENMLADVRALALRSFRDLYRQAGAVDWDVSAPGWPKADPAGEAAAVIAAEHEPAEREAAAVAAKADATHYLITAGGAVPVIADSEAAAMVIAGRMGIADKVTRVDTALSGDAWETATADKAEPETVSDTVRVNLQRQAGEMKAIADRDAGVPALRESIDVTPTWAAILPMLRLAAENGNATGRGIAWEELARMADAADRWNAAAKAERPADVIAEYPLRSDGCQAAGAIVLHRAATGSPFVVHFRNDDDSARVGRPAYYHGDYCETLADGWQAFADKIRRYDPTGALCAQTEESN